MGDERITWDHEALDQSGAGIMAAHDTADERLEQGQTGLNGLGPWWNPADDPNDVIGTSIGACYSQARQLMQSHMSKNLAALRSHGAAIRAMAARNQSAEDSTIDATTET